MSKNYVGYFKYQENWRKWENISWLHLSFVVVFNPLLLSRVKGIKMKNHDVFTPKKEKGIEVYSDVWIPVPDVPYLNMGKVGVIL